MISNPLEPKKEPQSRASGDGEAAKNPQPHPGETMSDERWVTLCARAAVEQDPKKLLDLVREINRLLEIRNKRLANSR